MAAEALVVVGTGREAFSALLSAKIVARRADLSFER
jgi:hypothetical protein